ncbi:peptide chain release factor N(5)-glutamine methyltransferase [Buchnera aphidicola str. APS (Acyrthosiphon pisum)]|uniref:Release factor glutamine methyltransferase n=2 Tax=Buchnera aphidicola TaxID=9 RepID=PRMC_BUCAI|nr:peptide chain release factor N(5)-glutamine methyltransferase [Buchnera aphidicola]P57269.1 RecName: Full=Release factor glutamine methyltransferase; Short=RF MTase; AltName: Full=M.BusHemKP; AltName: Full=N5-glutamine methyltransferase PrmC; AltName: Full=Protein-(glutamine-N5) MTase PrmC; AltName: Full=Protein-glutamine N-methyltransferase PrmC [Buchnera aphidicola str. APS (Acyrthosiphon pisum)]pir/A84950/ hemK protein [imported] - Buchnera sp. (strain APS) [Buchnera sp. (in: enterobacteria
MNIKKWIKKSIQKLSHVDNPKFESELLLSYVTKHTRSFIISSDEIQLTEKQYKYLNHLIHRRSLGEPIAYIIKEKEFWSLSLCVSYDTLIPRPDTEILVERALSKIKSNSACILDLGTGCGAIALALASINSNWNIIGIDKSENALAIARINASKLNFKNVTFFFSDWFLNIKKKFNIIVSNPPYVSKKEIKFFKKDIFFEPLSALISDNNGLSDIENIIKNSKHYLFYGGWLMIEHGWRQKVKVQYLFKKYNFHEIESYQDYGGNDRVTIGKKYDK